MTSNRLDDLRFESSGLLRHPDGGVDIAAYRRIAHAERLAAMHGWARDLYDALRGLIQGFERRAAPKQTLSSSTC